MAKRNQGKKTPEQPYTADDVRALGEEMNKLLFSENPMDFTKMDDAAVEEQVRADVSSIQPTDKFSKKSKDTLAAMGIQVNWIKSTSDGSKTEKKKSTAGKKTTKPTTEKNTKEKKPGVIATIVELCKKSGKKGISKEELITALIAKFPDREEKSMRNTINIQVPARINKERDFTLTKKNNRYFVV